MALVNPNIAMSFRQPEIQAPNALAQYAQIQQIMGGQQAQELNKLQIQEYQRTRDEEAGTRNFLRGRDLSAPDTRSGLAQFGKTGLAYAKLLQEQDTAALNAKNTQSQIDERAFGLQKKKLDFGWNAVGSATTPQAAIAEITKGVKDGVFDMKSATTEIQQLQNMTPEQYQQYRVQKVMGILDAKDKLGFMLPKVERQDIGGQIISIQSNPALPGYGMPVQSMAPIKKTATIGDTIAQGQLKVAQDRLANDQNPNVVARQVVGDDGTVTNYNKFGEIIGSQKGVGKTSATYAKTEAQKKTMAKDLDLAISELAKVTEKGGLIDQSTGSYLGKAIDVGARVFGQAMPGDIAAGQLAPIADLALKMVPRFEGPQSNADTTSYKQAAGQLADSTLPAEIRKAAGKEVLRLMKARKNQFITSDMASGNTAVPTSVAPPEGFVPD
jgi:hypothetical protein